MNYYKSEDAEILAVNWKEVIYILKAGILDMRQKGASPTKIYSSLFTLPDLPEGGYYSIDEMIIWNIKN